MRLAPRTWTVPVADALSITDAPPDALLAYSLGAVPLDAALQFQRRAHYEVTGDRSHGQLLLCEHHPVVTVGRQGSRAHVLAGPAELRARGWDVRWVARGGGCVLHLPGQLAAYAVMPLDALRLNVQQYLERLQACALDVLAGCEVAGGRAEADGSGVTVGGRPVASVGVAVRGWASTYGLVLNVHPDLDLLRRVRVGPGGAVPTSVERERRTPVRMPLARQLMLEAFERRFGFDRLSLFHSHPAFTAKASPDAVAPRR